MGDWKGYKHISAWGSSYSASLSLRLAAEHSEIKAVLAFYPGEYFDKPRVVANWARKVKVPTLMTFTEEDRRHEGNALFALLGMQQHTTIVSFPRGIHGSSTLREDINPKGCAEYWAATKRFILVNSAPE